MSLSIKNAPAKSEQNKLKLTKAFVLIFYHLSFQLDQKNFPLCLLFC
ncbi:hypothetical protein CHCC20335_0913 [Bacillus paralicheniformis]|nr:hypothetical protein CHCC20335_0913 [Bacillus paralicheniformis]